MFIAIGSCIFCVGQFNSLLLFTRFFCVAASPIIRSLASHFKNSYSTEKQGILEPSHTCLWAEIVECWLFCMSDLANSCRKIKPLFKTALLLFPKRARPIWFYSVWGCVKQCKFCSLRTDFGTRIFLVFHVWNFLDSGQGKAVGEGEKETRARAMCFLDFQARRELNVIYHKLEEASITTSCLYCGSILGF